MGLLLLVLSVLSWKQLISLINPALILVFADSSDIFHNLLIGPFLFLYTASCIRSGIMHKLRFHLLIILIILVLFSLAGFMQSVWKEILVVILLMINGLYFFQTLLLFTGLLKGMTTGWSHVMIRDYSLVTITNLLIFINLLLAILCPFICTNRLSMILQLPKGILVFYVYYLILRTSDFSMGAGDHGRKQVFKSRSNPVYGNNS